VSACFPVIAVLLIALAITATLLMVVVFRILLNRGKYAINTEQFLARILDGFPVPVFEIDSKHRVTQWNKALESLSGIEKADVMGTDLQWKAFYEEKRSVMADLIADGASEAEIMERYKNKARKSVLIDGAYEAEDFFPSLGEKGKWYRFTASPIREGDTIVGAIEILEDVTERHIAEENLRYYAGLVTRVQEEERKYIARELHDTTVQTLVALIYQLDNFMHSSSRLDEAEMARLKAMHSSLKRAVEEVRGFSRQLRPPVLDDLGLIPVLEWFTQELKKTYGLEVQVEITGNQRRLEPDTELALFRIIQEALINAAKHSGGKNASLKIDYLPGQIGIVVSDDGHGFELPDRISALPRNGKLGLAGIEERVQLLGGWLSIDSGKDRGTVLRVELPI